MEPRSPDFSFQDRLLSNNHEQDEELHEVIIRSRQEFMEQEKKRQNVEKIKKEFQKRNAVAISRLKLWKQTTTKEDERLCLHHLLNVLYIKSHPDRDDDDICVPDDIRNDLRQFLEQQIRPSKLYREIYDTCVECLDDHETL